MQKNNFSVKKLLGDISIFSSSVITLVIVFIITYTFAFALLSLKSYNSKFENSNQIILYLNDIESVQEDTGIKNYHPYKKALLFLSDYLEKLKENDKKELQEGLNLYNEIFEKYKSTYEVCIWRNFTPFQLVIEDCKTQGGVFIASSLSKPISASSLLVVIRNSLWQNL